MGHFLLCGRERSQIKVKWLEINSDELLPGILTSATPQTVVMVIDVVQKAMEVRRK